MFRLVLVVSALCSMSVVHGNPDEDSLFRELFYVRHYNRITHPVKNLSETSHVQLGLVLQKIVQVDELHQLLHANMWNRLKWKDYRLSWNASKFGGVDKIYVPVSRLWLPDITLWNNAQVEKAASDPETQFAVIYSHGLVHWWMPIGQSVAHCPMDITWFPLDTQNCPLIYESWSMPSAQLNITPLDPAIDLSYYQASGEWQLAGVLIAIEPIDYDCCASPFSRATFTVQLRRKSLYYVINLVVPCCLFSVIAIVTFILPPASGERVGIGITILLALSVYQMIVNEKLPATSDAVPLLGIYYTFVMLICAISVSVTMLVLCIYHQAPSHAAVACTPLPRWVRRYICGHLAGFLRMKNSSLFSHQKAECNSTSDMHYDVNNLETNAPTTSSSASAAVFASQSISSVERLLCSINELLETRVRLDARLHQQTDKNQQMMSEWMIAAAVIDRFCFIVFSFCFLIGTAVLFILATFVKD